jgi:hypothetical protein
MDSEWPASRVNAWYADRRHKVQWKVRNLRTRREQVALGRSEDASLPLQVGGTKLWEGLKTLPYR